VPGRTLDVAPEVTLRPGVPTIRDVTLRGTNATALFVIVLLAGALGLMLGQVAWQIGVFAVVLGFGALAFVGARVYLAKDVPIEPEAEVADEEAHLRYARYVFYVGAASIGILTYRPALSFSASDWFFFLAFGLTGLVLLTYGLERDYLIPSSITVGVALFAAGGIISSFHALSPLQSVSIVVRLLYLTIIWFWLATVLLQTRQHVEHAALAWIASAALSSSGAIVQFVHGDVIAGGTVAFGRMTGLTEHFNVLGGLAATSIVPAIMFSVDGSKRSYRIVGTVCTALIAAGLLLSGSVGGMLAATIGLLFWLAIRGVTARTVVSLVAVALTGLVLMSATGSTNSPDPLQRIRRVTSVQEQATGRGGTVYTRVDGYQVAWDHITRNPLIGVGLDDASSVEILGPELVHNMIIIPWFGAGILGLLGILFIIGGALTTGADVVRSSSRELRPLASALLAAVVTFVIFGMGEPILFVRYGWFPAMLLITLRAQQRRRLVEQRVPAPPRHSPLPLPGV
jgi:O-antigen ligase